MRDLKAYLFSYEEIQACLERLAESTKLEGRLDDMRPILLRETARIISEHRKFSQNATRQVVSI